MKCKNCKYYKKPKNDYDIERDLGKCTSPKFVYECNNNKPLNDMLAYWDYESYSAGFNVGKNFGCIHFTNK